MIGINESSSETKWGWLPLVSVAIVFSFIAFIIWIIFQGFLAIASKINEANFATVATLITALISLLGTLTVAYVSYQSLLKSKRVEKEKEIEQELRKQKAPSYEKFVKFLFEMHLADKNQSPLSKDQMIKFILTFSQEQIVWGGDLVIKAWSNFKMVSENPTYPVLFAMEDILFAIREDMGHLNKGLKRGDLLALYINDVHTIIDQNNLESADVIIKNINERNKLLLLSLVKP